MTLSETAAATHSCLRATPNSVACEKCLAAYLGVDRYDVLKESLNKAPVLAQAVL